MNKDRRKQLAEIAELLGELQERISVLKDEEEEGFDNLPESLQQGERGQAMEAAKEQMESAMSAIEEAVGCLQEAQA